MLQCAHWYQHLHVHFGAHVYMYTLNTAVYILTHVTSALQRPGASSARQDQGQPSASRGATAAEEGGAPQAVRQGRRGTAAEGGSTEIEWALIGNLNSCCTILLMFWPLLMNVIYVAMVLGACCDCTL